MELRKELYRFVAPIKRSISLLLGRALLESVNDKNYIPLIKVSLFKDEVKEGIEFLQPYGLTSIPRAGSEVLVGFIGGTKEQGIAIVVNDSRARMKQLEIGDVALHRQETDKVWIKLLANDTIEINGKNININLEAGGKLNVANGNLTVEA